MRAGVGGSTMRGMTRVTVAVVGSVLLVAGCGSGTAAGGHPSTSAATASLFPPPVTDPPTVTDTPASAVSVEFDLTGTATSADITYSVGGGEEQRQGVDVPLTDDSGLPGLHFTAQPGQFLYFSAQNNGGGSLSCQIVTDQGGVVDQHTSSGDYAVVTCEATA